MDKEDSLVFGWDFAHREYTCTDGSVVVCTSIDTYNWGIRYGVDFLIPRNGLSLYENTSWLLTISEVSTNRRAREVLLGSDVKTYTFPKTVIGVG